MGEGPARVVVANGRGVVRETYDHEKVTGAFWFVVMVKMPFTAERNFDRNLMLGNVPKRVG